MCAFWLLYMGALGMFFPFYGLYLRESAGLSGTQAGLVYAMLPLVGTLAQPFWGHLADRTGRRTRLLAVLALGAAAGQLGIGQVQGFVPLLLATAAAAACMSAVVPMAVSVSLALLHEGGRHAFGVARAFGTVGFGVSVLGFPLLLERTFGPATPGAPPPGLGWMFPAAAALIVCGAVAAALLPRTGSVALRAHPGDLGRLLRHPPMRRILAWSFLVFFFLQGPMALFPLFVTAIGGGLESLSRMWIVMLLLEVPLLALSGTLLARLGARALLAVGAVSAGVRWIASGASGDLAMVTALGLLHGVVVTGITIGGPLYVEETIPAPLRSTGQALLATVGTGLGGALSSVACGWMIDRAGAAPAYASFGAGALVLGALVVWVLPPPRRFA